CAGWVTTLNHKRRILDNAVERYTIVETITRQKHEIVHGDGRFLRIQLDVKLALAGVETRGVVLLRVDLHRGGTAVLLVHCNSLRIVNTAHQHIRICTSFQSACIPFPLYDKT